jgi:hypothetical protein
MSMARMPTSLRSISSTRPSRSRSARSSLDGGRRECALHRRGERVDAWWGSCCGRRRSRRKGSVFGDSARLWLGEEGTGGHGWITAGSARVVYIPGGFPRRQRHSAAALLLARRRPRWHMSWIDRCWEIPAPARESCGHDKTARGVWAAGARGQLAWMQDLGDRRPGVTPTAWAVGWLLKALTVWAARPLSLSGPVSGTPVRKRRARER